MQVDLQYLVIEGNIGAGKTTLSTMLSHELGAKLVLERFADNPFLPKFYADSERYGFQLELSFLAERYHQLNAEIRERSLFQPLTIADYFFMKSLIFAQNTLKDDELHLYQQLFNIMHSTLPRPDLYVYLHLPPERLLQNIKRRGREYEQSIALDYLERIAEGYFTFFKQHPEYTFLVIDTQNIDFVGNPDDYLKIKQIILGQKYTSGVHRVLA
ncbi:MAG: deoxynucleoside kinase [Bacteroidales bacterium]|nr:deoxynucleoside kinase [Bacteroidales bacterium]